MRYYYKTKSGNGFLNLKSPLSDNMASDYIEITEEEFNENAKALEHVPTDEELRVANIYSQIDLLKSQLAKTDYIACKLAECVTDEERSAMRMEYSSQLARRAEIRAQINALEAQL